MGFCKIRTEYINSKINSKELNPEEKRLFSNGFIPAEFGAEWDQFYAMALLKPEAKAEDTDAARISNANWFADKPSRVAGEMKAGTSLAFPVTVKGTLNDALNVINNIVREDKPKEKEHAQEKEKQMEQAKAKFNIGDEVTVSGSGKTGALSKIFVSKRSVIIPGAGVPTPTVSYSYLIKFSDGASDIEDEQNLSIAQKEKSKPMATNKEKFTPKVEVSSADLAVIKKKRLMEDDTTSGKKTQDTEDTIKKYNPAISDDEIKAWVYHKRRFGNPMRGWEKYFLSGGSGSNTLLKTIRDTVIKDNKYADLRTIPANTVLGAKTKFRNTYGTDTLVICKTATGELVWVNTADVKEQKNVTSESQAEIDKLVKAKALIYDGNEYYPYPVYLFGNIYDKIKTLKENEAAIAEAYGAKFVEEQMKLVKTYMPKAKSFRDPVKSNRPSILCLSEFATKAEQFGITELNEEVGIKMGETKRGRFREVEEKISLFDAFKYWMEETVRDTDLKGTTRANIRKYYFAKSISWEKDPDGKDILTNTQKEELIGAARMEAESLFSEFLATGLTFEDGVALDAIWNEKYNAFTSLVPVEGKIGLVDKVPIGFESSTMFKKGEFGIKPAQRQGLAYLQLVGSGCAAYNVGFGKTTLGITNLAQLLSQGAVKRPLIVVPKPTYKNWLKELFGYWSDGENEKFEEFKGATFYYGVLSGLTNIKVNDWYNLSGKHYKRLLEQNGGDINKLIPENTITIVSYKGFEQMGFGRGMSQEMFDSIARVIMQKDAMEGSGNEKKDQKDAASFYQKVQGWLGIGNKNAMVNVDTCGFDHITVDEAHNFKNVFPSCGKDPATGRKLFGISAGQSSRAVKMFFITNYIQRKYGKNVVLLTATPFTNSPLEIYSMLSFVGLETLNQYNLFNIKKFFEQFVLETIEYAIDSKGEIITKPVIKSFQNLKLLQTVLFNHFHYKDDPKEAGVVRPCKIDLPNKDISTYLEMSEWQRKNQAKVKEMAKSVSRANPGASLKAMAMSLDNAFSPYLFRESKEDQGVTVESAADFVDQSPKIKYAVECVRTLKEWHEARGESPSGVVLYSNRGKDYFEYIKDYLIDNLGYKRRINYGDGEDAEIVSEVEIITGGGGEADEDRKEVVKSAFNAGIVKVIIGTATIREGINLQERGSVIIDLYPEWNPTDVTQLKGRIWRQGNMYGYVRFVMPLVINSMDNFINQKLDEKSKRIANLWNPVGDQNALENSVDLDPSEIKYALVDDANEKFKMRFDTLKNDLNREFAILNDQREMMGNVANEIDKLKENEASLCENLMEKKPQFLAYQKALKKADLKALKEKDLKKTVSDIERVLGSLDDLLEAVTKYEANRYDIPLLFAALRIIKQRDFNVFTDHSTTGRELEETLSETHDWRTFNVYDDQYNRLVSAWASVQKAQKSVLNAYGKGWQDDLGDIIMDVSKKIEKLKLQAEQVQSEEYKASLLAEINAEMEAAKAVRGNLTEQVQKFASLNHVLSYLSDNTDKENCPIPTDPCCPTNGINIVHGDKDHPQPVITVPKGPKSSEKIAEEKQSSEIQEAIGFLNEMLPDLKGKQKKEAQEAIEFLKEMMPVEQMAGGGPADFEMGYEYEGEVYSEPELIELSNTMSHYERMDNETGAITTTEEALAYLFPKEMRRGGPVKRPLSAIARDRKYYNPSQEHEVRYAQANHRKKKRYNKLATGGPAGDYTYHINLDERGEFDADVLNAQGETVFEINGFGIFEDGFMKHKEDIAGLRSYLISLGIIPPSSSLVEAMAKGGPIDGYIDLSKVKKSNVVNDPPKEKVLNEVEVVRAGIQPFEGNKQIRMSTDASEVLYSIFDPEHLAVEENFFALFVDRANKVISYLHVSKGGVSSTVVDVEIVAAAAVKVLAQGVIIAHNHPSGNLKPSDADLSITRKLKEALRLFDIQLLDSMIVIPNSTSYYSMADEGQMRRGGPAGRPLSAIARDRKYYNENQPHEVRYAKEHNRKKKKYKKSK